MVRDRNLTRWIFVLPAVIIVGLLFVYPFFSSIFYSFTNKNLIMPNYRFVGLDNYKAVLSDPNFFSAFFNSIKWTVLSLAGQVIIGFVLALALHRVRRFKKLYRTLLIVPWAFPTIVIAFSWQWILNGVYGYLPNIIVKLGLMEHAPAFLTDSTWAFICLVFINIWFGAPMIMVNVLSALQTVPQEQFEAAKIDGATSWQVFRHITFPHIKVVVGLLVVLRTVWIFNNFDIIYLITGGGPSNATMTLPIFAYNLGWGTKLLGRASAVTVLLFIFLLTVCFIYFSVISKWEKEGRK
ncbi:Inner membrane ABC transporter permease protein YcjO [Streptococcus sanguinis]|jgi:ABC sugar transporter, permease protein, putative|uniref:ABC sugar transporter, permease protein, putative n=5 Tax=Streptococcus TaxID=1301 RepID=A3CK34_STRSV|nr:MULTISPECIES: sugar ABC transporter permease [Streptococcus]ABN43539.1 ABC sugar transporter, permease protein, putative [Streptococcus sanguinis SK36]EFX52532.1 ABC transporter, permease protein [Streptococcus cristatus ATCC 51100]EGC21973.1 ABC transporter, permease protein [Streptococcus sanguinis SK353]EGU68997.1 ABC transporter, permease protein [Streptococcus cristatus ATCC 51100]KAA0117507.1 sugar ABC transporter permease [Streptococcus sanguinis]